ncbi:UPF0029-domain-containing protein [Obba rivulosa]|uniref:UPF0029-domain-containing protein n=1 Tax=Obba rivulosa TaxID=1052685 RepID=A0A8E2DU78_9APHY|nr:UPF0029-domain-containing protein [Obba rivulosa]
MSSPSTSSIEPDSIDALITELSFDPDREPIASELGALQSIYGDDALRIWHGRSPSGSRERGRSGLRDDPNDAETIRYEVKLSIPSEVDTEDEDGYPLTILVSLPRTYPTSSPPQLQLLSRYIGPFGVDSALFGAILRTYISRDGVEWTPGCVCVFDGLEWVRERCTAWVGERKTAVKIGELMRGDEKGSESPIDDLEMQESRGRPTEARPSDGEGASKMPEGIEIIEAEPILDRKSAFVGRACRITDPVQVPMILAHLMADRRISRAAHPIINAWRCRVGSVLHQDNDDDGETAAGGRLAHLLQILEVDNVLVIVTRYFGGIHLGPDRFKHINQAARNALEIGGFLDTPGDAGNGGRRKGKGPHSGAAKR